MCHMVKIMVYTESSEICLVTRLAPCCVGLEGVAVADGFLVVEDERETKAHTAEFPNATFVQTVTSLRFYICEDRLVCALPYVSFDEVSLR